LAEENEAASAVRISMKTIFAKYLESPSAQRCVVVFKPKNSFVERVAKRP
jgi:hypothetical protein